MSKFIGESAGFALLILIWILVLQMVKEFHILPEDKAKEVRKVSVFIFAAGIGYLVSGGFFYNASVEKTSIFQYDVIWNYGNYAKIIEGVKGGSCHGFFNMLFAKAAYAVGTVFFKQYLSAAVYTSMFFSVFFGTGGYFLIKRLTDRETAWKLLPFLFLWPGAYKMFLPSPASLIGCIFILLLWCFLHKKKVIIQNPIRQAYRGWVYDSALCFFCALNMMIYYTEVVVRR